MGGSNVGGWLVDGLGGYLVQGGGVGGMMVEFFEGLHGKDIDVLFRYGIVHGKFPKREM